MQYLTLVAAAVIALAGSSASGAAASEPVKVFILAGQSNMEGKAPVALLDRQIANPKTAEMFAHLHVDGEYVERDDVFIKFLNRRGKLTVGYGSPNRVGAELQFGHVMGDHFGEPVLLIKTAWGGKSIARDFRPPSAGLPGDEALNEILEQTNENNRKNNRPEISLDDVKQSYGHFYRAMIEDVQSTIASVDELFPELAGRECELSGFVWFQGWNDQYGGAALEYEENLAHFVRDVRRDLDAPDLPVAIGMMGQNGSEPATGPMLTIQQAQQAVAEMREFEGNVVTVRTDELVDKAAEKLFPEWRERQDEWDEVGGDFKYHYYGSPIWFTRIGQAFADAMLELLSAS